MKLFVTFLDEFWLEGPEVQSRIIQNTRIAGKDVKQRIPQDPGQAGKSQIKSYSIQLPGYNFDGVIETGSKDDRAEPVGNWAKINKVYIWSGAADPELIQRFIKQCAGFPGGKHKDFVDAFSGAFSQFEIQDEEITPSVMELPMW